MHGVEINAYMTDFSGTDSMVCAKIIYLNQNLILSSYVYIVEK